MPINESNQSYSLLLQRVETVTVYSRVFTSHGADVRAQLSAVVNDVEEKEPHHITPGNSQQGFARYQ